jgi:hypothetical protein
MQKILLLISTILLTGVLTADAGQIKYSKSDIRQLAKIFLNSTSIENPIFADVDNDGDFDILHFTDEGFVEYYRNSGSNEAPSFELADKKYDDYEVHSLFGTGLPFPAFMADCDGDGDKDMFALTSKPTSAGSNVEIVENQFEVTQGLLITIILVLGIIALLIFIL